ncbi:MAG: capsular biosynthesis protein [Ruminococcaceae bacterium]|nr:capsular biosynthesis protein [Oscillospiraceae bacterium]
MPNILSAPENFRVTPRDGSVLSEWDAVDGAVGYRLFYYTADEPNKCIKTRYAQDPKKVILGFENGREYLVQVCAVRYNGNTEEKGEMTEKLPFVPFCDRLKAQSVLCLKKGETAQLVCERRGETPHVTYRSENSDIASVNASGQVTANAVGTAYIKITASDGQTFRTKVAVERSLCFSDTKAVIMLAGDIMCAVGHQRAAEKLSYDFNGTFGAVRDILSQADYRIGVLETSCYDGAPFEHEQLRLAQGSPNCNSPSTFISAIANAGFDGLVTANNHNCDTGNEGLAATVAEIKKNGMANFGALGDNPVIVDIKGIKVGIIACCMISNGLEGDMSDDEMSFLNIIGKYDREYFVELVNRAAGMGAEYIIAYQHWGGMNALKLKKAQTDEAKFMAESGASLIVGSHPHVVQQFRYIKTSDGRVVPCAYSLGNFVTSMSELRENRDSALLRVELTRVDGKVKASLSYIPCFCENSEGGVSVVTAFPPHSNDCLESYYRTKAAMGKLINHFEYRPLVALMGSAVLGDIFKAGRGFRTDKTPMFISPLSLGSDRGFEAPEGDEKLALEINKDVAGYIKKTEPDYIAVDFYTAASVSVHRMGSPLSDDLCYFTNIKRFRNSEVFKEHKDEFVRIRPPFGESIWKPMVKRFAEKLLEGVPHDRIMLFRFNSSGRKAEDTELRNSVPPQRLNKLVRAMEDYFISIVNPCVIDLSDKYFTLAGSDCEFENDYYIDAFGAAKEIAEKKGRSYISVPDTQIWFGRVMKYYDNMTARAYQSWLLDMTNAADIIIAQTSKEFAARNSDRLIRLKKAGKTELTSLKDFFTDDSGAGEVIRAAEIINALDKGNIDKPYDFFAPAFNGHYNILKKMVRLLSIEIGAAVNQSSAEIVFLLRGKAQLKRYISTLNEMTIDIWGSCVSRESINRCKDAFVGKYIFKQAQILAYEEPISAEFPEGAEAFCGNFWRKRTMQDAFNRNGFDVLEESDSRWIMVDLYDLICNMAEYKGGLFEVDDFILRTDFYKSIKNECSSCYLFGKRDMKYCFENITRFANDILEMYGENIILIKTEPKSKYITTDYHLADFKDDGMTEFKKKFIALCEERFASVTGCYVIDISKHFYASDRFPLGGAHIVHYEEEFYRQAAEYISEILKGTDKKIFSSIDDTYLLLRTLKLDRDKQ